MPVAPYCSNFQDRQALYQCLSNYQQQSIERETDLIVSVTSELGDIDPLSVLQDLSTPGQPHFYLEKGSEGEAIAAIGSVKTLFTQGKQRFSTSQQFITQCLNRMTWTDAQAFPGCAPRFFCSFSFFDQILDPSVRFAAAQVVLPQWQVMRRQEGCVATANILIGADSDLVTITDTLWQQFKTMRLAKFGLFNLPDPIRQRLNQWQVIEGDRFKSAVNSALRLIQQNQLSKLVVADVIDVISRLPFEWVQSLHHLRQMHPDSYVFSVGNGQGQSFIGASPERLIRIRNSLQQPNFLEQPYKRLLLTDALAGSAPRGKTIAEDLVWGDRLINSEKEQREHQVVVNFIRQQLSDFGLNPQGAASPALLKLPNIQHLHTPIQAVMPSDFQPLKVLAQLHPTPAVAGLPRAIACEQIRHLEAFERSLYAAPLGWVDINGDAEFIVGIRSALIEGCHARLYAGAGIVEGSNPDRELAEVKLKFQALLQALV
jgi:menaquinone-specific isochorismate synthase